MIRDTENSALLEELATHSKRTKGKRRACSTAKTPKQEEKGLKGKGDNLSDIKKKMTKMVSLNKAEIKRAVEAGVIHIEQTWNWIPSNIDCLKEGIKDMESGNYNGPYNNVDELLLSLKP